MSISNQLLLVLSGSLTALLIAYTLSRVSASRFDRKASSPRPPAVDRLFVFMVPCLNEELVISSTLQRLLSIEGNTAILVIDDGSDDRTVDEVQPYLSDRVWLLSRRKPFARMGKGMALNAGYLHLLGLSAVRSRPKSDVILVIMDGDGRLEPNALAEVAPYFDDPATGAVQVGVRMYNANHNVLTRLQDFEFVSYTEIFQRSRKKQGTCGLGGNGQFTRLSAIMELGPEPWTDRLTEDLDLGLNLIAKGWATSFCASTWVSQQALTRLRLLVRQRARWFQGHLQCWGRIRALLKSERPLGATSELVHHLLSPILIAFLSIPTALFFGSLITLAAVTPGPLAHTLTAHDGLLIAVCYVLCFATAIPYSMMYARHTGESRAKSVLYGHLYAVYCLLWYPACWIALTRIARRSRGWSKTTRAAEAVDPQVMGGLRGIGMTPTP
jgi:1,2-diacylglycerol 3-beta-glucosyltransferase